jgi:hypothetical protein
MHVTSHSSPESNSPKCHLCENPTNSTLDKRALINSHRRIKEYLMNMDEPYQSKLEETAQIWSQR